MIVILNSRRPSGSRPSRVQPSESTSTPFLQTLRATSRSGRHHYSTASTLERPMMIVGHISLSKHRRSPDLIALKSWAIAPMAMNFCCHRSAARPAQRQCSKQDWYSLDRWRYDISLYREADGCAVFLIQSNAAGLGCWLAEPNTQINLHNRGLGFSLEPGHPAVFGQRSAPPHTLSPALATRDREFVSVFGTMGGDAQPQILLQIAARLFQHQQSPAEAIHAARWALAGPTSGFDTWDDMSQQQVLLEGHSPSTWRERLTARGHRMCNQSGIQHLDMPTPSFVTSMVLPEPPIRELGSRVLDANSSSAIHSTSTRVPTSANDQRNSAS